MNRKRKNILKAFGYKGCPEDRWGVEGGVIFAESIEEAKIILDDKDYNIWEIEIKKGMNSICSYFE